MSLRELLQQWIEKESGRSGRGIADAARLKHHKISHATVSNIVSGRHGGEVGEATIAALSAGTGIPEREIRRAAGVPEVNLPFVLPPEASRLTHRQREAVREVVDAMLKPEGRAGRMGSVTGIPVRPDSDAVRQKPDRAAARRDEKLK